MDCKEARSLLSAYVDGELDARSALALDTHVSGCAECANALAAIKDTQKIVRSAAPYYEAPDAVRRNILNSIKSRQTNRWPMAARAAAMAASILLALGIGWWTGHSGSTQGNGSEVLSSHLRALMSDHVADVVSTDKHTVKPWFNGKIDFSPPVNDFASSGFPLIGARLEFLNGRRVGVLVYKRAKHIIDLYIAPTSGSEPAEEQTMQGFNQIHWKAGGFEYWAISDLNFAELRQFASQCR